MKPIELIHDYLLDRRVFNIVFDNDKSPKLSQKGQITAGVGVTGTVGFPGEEVSQQQLVLVSPNEECPTTTVATIRTVKQDGRTKVEIDCYLLREMQIPMYAKKWSPCRWRLDLENPASLDNVICILQDIAKKYNEFIKIMNSFGSDLLSDVMMWNSMEFRELVLRR
jgi:hypothetical protein